MIKQTIDAISARLSSVTFCEIVPTTVMKLGGKSIHLLM